MFKYTLPAVVCVFLFLISCKKEDDQPVVQPETEKPKGSLNIAIQSYDSLGTLEGNLSGAIITITANVSCTTGTNGSCSFSNLNQSVYVPIINKLGYEYLPTSISINSSGLNKSITIPLAKTSTYKLQNLGVSLKNKDSILTNFNLHRPITSGQTVKLAVISSTNSGLGSHNFTKADYFIINNHVVTQYNIAGLPELKSSLAALPLNGKLYISIIPVTYGDAYSSVFNSSILLGENEVYPGTKQITKNWN